MRSFKYFLLSSLRSHLSYFHRSPVDLLRWSDPLWCQSGPNHLSSWFQDVCLNWPKRGARRVQVPCDPVAQRGEYVISRTMLLRKTLLSRRKGEIQRLIQSVVYSAADMIMLIRYFRRVAEEIQSDLCDWGRGLQHQMPALHFVVDVIYFSIAAGMAVPLFNEV